MVTLPADMARRIEDAWVRNLKAEAPDMYAKLLARIPDMGRFTERIGQPSSDGFGNYVNPAFISRTGENAAAIRAGQAANLKRTYRKYAAKLKFLFETVDGIPAKRYLERVEAMREAFRHGVLERTIPFTGTKAEGLGCTPLALMWLVADHTIGDQLRAGDKMEKAPFRICRIEDVSPFKAALAGRLNQAGAALVKAEYDPAVIAAQNDRTNRIVQNFVDPGLNLVPFATGGASHLDFILVDGQPFLEIRVTQRV